MSSSLSPDPARLVSTYSIVARDAASGDMGVAVQSHYFAVGTTVPWAESGVGAVASQAFAEMSYGPLGLRRLAEGASPRESLDALLASDSGRDSRQVAIVDAAGRTAAHTGSRCVLAAGHRVGDGYSAQGNMLASEAWQAMGETFEASGGMLEGRLFAALEAAELSGGDLRGRQSAAILVVSGRRSKSPWREQRLSLRVDDHREPLVELARLMQLQHARELFEEASRCFAEGDRGRALAKIEKALALSPDNPEFSFWTGVAYANDGRVDEALPLLHVAFVEGDGWRELLRRLPRSGMLRDDPELIDRLCRA